MGSESWFLRDIDSHDRRDNHALSPPYRDVIVTADPRVKTRRTHGDISDIKSNSITYTKIAIERVLGWSPDVNPKTRELLRHLQML
jgi:hypothetical protein